MGYSPQIYLKLKPPGPGEPLRPDYACEQDGKTLTIKLSMNESAR